MDSATNENMGKIAQTEDILVKIAKEYGEKAVFTSSFGTEDMVITHLISKLDLDIEIATIDTGRLHQDTYDFIDRAVKFYGLKLKSYFPEAGEVEEMVRESGHNLFYYSQENRKTCCNIRKVSNHHVLCPEARGKNRLITVFSSCFFQNVFGLCNFTHGFTGGTVHI